MTRILITGATGFLGGWMARELHRDGHAVVGMGRDPAALARLEADGIAPLAHDLAEPLPQGILSGIDKIVHCAAKSAPSGRLRAFERANVNGTAHLIAAAEKGGVTRIVHISSPSVYFTCADQLDVPEDMPLPPPFNAYAATKQQAEALMQRAGGPSVITLRPRGIYGPGDTTLLPRVLAAARRGALPLFRGGRGAIDLTFVGDVVSAMRAALDAPDALSGRVFNVSGGEMQPIRDIVAQVCDRAGLSPRWRTMPLRPALWAAAGLEAAARALPHDPEPPVTRYGLALFAYAQSLSLTAAARDLGWTPTVSFAEGLERTFAVGPSS